MKQDTAGIERVFEPSPRITRTVFNLFQLPNRIAIVTGGHRGIGQEIAFAYAEAGAIVYCIDLPQKPDEDWIKAKKYIDSLPEFQLDGGGGCKGRLEYVHANVTDQKQMVAVAEDIARREGHIDICVACAGILRSGDCLTYSAEEFQKLMDVNVNGVLFTAQAAGQIMEHTETPGSIILIGSISGSVANKGLKWSAYNCSKGAVLQMVKGMASELGAKGIRVNSISPGYIETQMTKDFMDKNPHLREEWSSMSPFGRIGRPDELRGIALWLAGDGSTFCTGSNIVVDGGYMTW